MKGLFPQYRDSKQLDYADIWSDALFIFDTNVLLNLYRYQTNTREELLNILSKLEDRIWIPHHVALEFQRNRLPVIAEQGRRFTGIREAIESSKSFLSKEIGNLNLRNRHALIDPEPLIKGFEKLTKNFLLKLEKLQETQQKLTEPDHLRERIEELFNGKVGNQHKTQSEINELNKEGELRYKAKIPPGYMDEGSKEGPEEYMHNGIFYKRKFGDFILWKQLLDKAKSHPSKKVIFITDDTKEDWWTKIQLDGPKTIGPRPELLDEAIRLGDLKGFLMYKPEAFLKYATQSLEVSVSEETIDDVRNISINNTAKHSTNIRAEITATNAEYAVKDWLSTTFQHVEGVRASFPDFIVHHEDDVLAFEVFLFTPDRLDRELRIFNDICETENFFNQDLFDDLTIIWVVNKESDLPTLSKTLKKYTNFSHNHNLSIQAALMESTGNFPTITKVWPLNTW